MTARRTPVTDDNGGLTFINSTARGTVHVIGEWTAEDLAADQRRLPTADPETRILMLGILGATRTLCGLVLYRTPDAKPRGDLIGAFADDRLCWRCHRALGDDSDRAFEHPVPAAVGATP